MGCAKSLQLCPTLCFPMDHSLPGSSGRTSAMDFSRQKYWSGLPCPPPGDLPNQGIKLGTSYILLAGGFFISSATWWALTILSGINYLISHFTSLFCLYHCCNLCSAARPCPLTFEEPFALSQELQMNTYSWTVRGKRRRHSSHEMPSCMLLSHIFDTNAQPWGVMLWSSPFPT